MRTQHSTVTVADYCQGLERKEYNINTDYQRSDAVWPTPAKSFLIETILLDFPVPKLSLHQRLELTTRTTIKDIVDGQQRSGAIMAFYHNELRLARTLTTEGVAGKKFLELDEDFQRQFLSYGLNFDVFVNATAEDVREVFRRMNSFTVPLNPEEARHANYQGPFKWFIHALSRDYDKSLKAAGVFTEKQINRMTDAKLFTDIVHAVKHGISTTNKASLDKLYNEFDEEFPGQEDINDRLRRALDRVLGNSSIRGTALMRHYNIYSLVLAYVQADGLEVQPAPRARDVEKFRHAEPDLNLSILAEALGPDDLDYEADDEEDDGDSTATAKQSDLADFLSATREKTNVAAQRLIRFEFFLTAITY